MEISPVEYGGLILYAACAISKFQFSSESLTMLDRQSCFGGNLPRAGQSILKTIPMMTDTNCKLEVYKAFVETIIASENRRQQTSTIYLGMVVVVSTVAGAVGKIELIYPASIVLVLSTVWFLSVRYFRKLAQAKFFVISEIEKDLPIAPFRMEWNKFVSENASQISLTYLEMSIPAMLGFLCAGYILFRVIA